MVLVVCKIDKSEMRLTAKRAPFFSKWLGDSRRKNQICLILFREFFCVRLLFSFVFRPAACSLRAVCQPGLITQLVPERNQLSY
jgi:hypothetical protein